MRKNIEFNAEGVTLRGWFYQPEGGKSKYPTIIMSHGYNCLKEFFLDTYAEKFVAAGFAVLIYDNRNFGDSDGLPRQELDPWQQVRDYRHAITFVQTLDCVDEERIGIWGTSYSGGHVLVVTALDKRVKCVVSQVPTISGWNGMLRRVSPKDWAAMYQDFDADRMNRFLGKEPAMRPMIEAPNDRQQASHASIDAWEFFNGQMTPETEKWRFNKWKNEITLRSIEMYSEYEPGSYIKRIAPIPLLMIVAKNDVVAVTDEALEAFNQAREVKKLHLFPGNHFSAYADQHENVCTAATEWFLAHL
jgi:hypothetical protein